MASQRVGTGAAAVALGKERRTLQRWAKREGYPADAQGLVDVDELRAWAIAQGLLDRQAEDGRPAGVDAALAGASSPAAPTGVAAGLTSPAPALAKLELSEDDRLAISALEDGDPEQLVRLASRLTPDVLKRLAATARLRKDVAEAEAKELAVRQAAGELVALRDVRAFWAAQRHVVTAAFQALPGKLAPLLANQEYETVYGALERELDAVLRALAREPLSRG